MLAVLVGFVAAVLWSCHPSASGRIVRRWLVEAPAAWLDRVTGWRLALVALAVAPVAAAVLVLDVEAAEMAAWALGEGVAWFVAFDVGTWVEVYAVLWLLGAARVFKPVVRHTRILLTRAPRRLSRSRDRRAPRTPRAPKRPPPTSDDAPAPWGVALAA